MTGARGGRGSGRRRLTTRGREHVVRNGRCRVPVGLVLLLTALHGGAATFHVAPNGSDAWSGRLPAAEAGGGTNGPLATLAAARDRVRRLGPPAARGEPVTVWLRGGLYALPQGLVLDRRDGGTPAAPVVYRAWPDERPVLVGGRPITGFTTHTGAVLKADVAAQGFKRSAFRQLLCGGARQHLARYPNYDPENPCGGGWAFADGKLVPMYQEVPGEDKCSFAYKAVDARRWSHPEEVEVFVFARYNWWNDIRRIKTLDPATRRVTLTHDASYAIRPGDRYYFRNALEELDAPGEWYLDAGAGVLYFWPPAPLAGRVVVAPTTRTILELAPGTAEVTFRGLTFECAEGTALRLRGTTNCLVAACTIRNVGDYGGSGVAIEGGVSNGVAGCDIHDTGRDGVSLDGGDRRTLTPAGNYADNNYIHHVGVFYKQGVGVALRGCGNRATHNLIHDGPRMGIMFGGNNLLIAFNHIRHVNLETADTGAIYTGGRDWLGSRGTVVRHNYFHDIIGFGFENGRWTSPHYAWGIYLDDNTGGVDVYGNIVARCIRGLIHLHNGRDNHVENNIFVGGTLQQIECNGWTPAHRYWVSHLPTMIQGYESVTNQPAWRALRHMELHPTNAVLPDGTIMAGNRFARNIVVAPPGARYVKVRTFSFAHNSCDSNLVWAGGAPPLTGETCTGADLSTNKLNEWQSWQARGMDVHALVADPLFIDAAHDDYRLRPDSPAFALGFKPIPVEQIGPYASPLRASWPIIEAEGAREHPFKAGR